MSDRTFHCYAHTHVTVEGLGEPPRPIIHTTGRQDRGTLRVWISCSYADDLPEGAVVAGDGLSDGYDEQGNRIVSVPAALCWFHTEEEADTIAAVADADERLLSCAR